MLARSTRDLFNTLDAIAEGRSRIPFAWRYTGGHDNAGRAAQAHCAGRSCRVRARIDPVARARWGVARSSRNTRSAKRSGSATLARRRLRTRVGRGEGAIDLGYTVAI